MAKSKILQEITNKSISAEIALRRLYVIASDLEDEALLTWVEKELNGYDTDDDVPEYRDIGIGTIIYSGLKGTLAAHLKINKAPFPPEYIPSEYYSKIEKHYRKDTIAFIEKQSQKNDLFCTDLSMLIPFINQGMAITEFYRQYDSSSFAEIVNKISSMLLKIFIKLDKTIGNLDDLDIGQIDKEKKTEIKEYVHKIIYINNSINIGDNNKILKSEVGTK